MGGGLYGGHLPQSSLGCPLSTPSSRLSLCYDGTRLAITGPCPSTKSEYFLAVYTADGLEYLGGYTSSLYGNHPPDCYPWGSWQDGSCRSIALEPSLPGTEKVKHLLRTNFRLLFCLILT